MMFDNVPLTADQAAEIRAQLMRERDESLATAQYERDRTIERAKRDYADAAQEILYRYERDLVRHGLSAPVDLYKQEQS